MVYPSEDCHPPRVLTGPDISFVDRTNAVNHCTALPTIKYSGFTINVRVYMCVCTAVCESSGTKWRSVFGVGWNTTIALGAASMPAVAYFVRNYQHLQAVYAWPQFALFAYALYVCTKLLSSEAVLAQTARNVVWHSCRSPSRARVREENKVKTNIKPVEIFKSRRRWVILHTYARVGVKSERSLLKYSIRKKWHGGSLNIGSVTNRS